MALDRSSRARLNLRTRELFTSDTLFDEVARTVCSAECLPRKELFEAWEVARRVRRLMRGGRITELGAGHGLLAMLLLILDDSSPNAICYDREQPKSFSRLWHAIVARWPRLEGRVDYRVEDLHGATIVPDDLVVSVHACGALTDAVLDLARSANARLAVLPCCHDLETCDTAGLDGWMHGPLAIDAARMLRLRDAGYEVFARQIPADITPMNRLLIAQPLAANADG